jgi:hypothetical protein
MVILKVREPGSDVETDVGPFADEAAADAEARARMLAFAKETGKRPQQGPHFRIAPDDKADPTTGS